MAKPSEPMTFHTVRAMGLKFAGAEAGTAYGSPALTVNGRWVGSGERLSTICYRWRTAWSPLRKSRFGRG
jgi:hypothetical protein